MVNICTFIPLRRVLLITLAVSFSNSGTDYYRFTRVLLYQFSIDRWGMKKLNVMFLLLTASVTIQGHAACPEEGQMTMCVVDQCPAYDYCIEKHGEDSDQCDMSELCECKPVYQDREDKVRCGDEDAALFTSLTVVKQPKLQRCITHNQSSRWPYSGLT